MDLTQAFIRHCTLASALTIFHASSVSGYRQHALR